MIGSRTNAAGQRLRLWTNDGQSDITRLSKSCRPLVQNGRFAADRDFTDSRFERLGHRYQRRAHPRQHPLNEMNSPRAEGNVGVKGAKANDFEVSNPAAAAALTSANGVSA